MLSCNSYKRSNCAGQPPERVALSRRMSKSYVMTLRLPEALGLEVERTAARQGNKAAQLGAWFIEEGLRRRKHPLIDLRETSAGRVAYVNGTRFAAYSWACWYARRGASGPQSSSTPTFSGC